MDFINNLDDAILQFIDKNMHIPILDKIMVFFTTIGNLGIVWIVIFLILLISKKYRKVGLIGLIALLLTQIICNDLLKNLFQRERPFLSYPELVLLIKSPTSYSFPSGHTMSSFASAFVIAKHIKKLAIPTFILASLIAFSRLYLYVHFLTDVMVGIILGYIVYVLANYIVKLLTSRKNESNESEKLSA